MIGGLQGDFGDLDNKYLKMSVRNIRKIQEKFRCTVQKWLSEESKLTAADALRVSAIRRSGHVWPRNLKRLPLPSGCEIFGCEMSANGISDVKYPEKVDCRPDWIPPRVEWAMPGVAIRSNSIRIPPRGHAPPCYSDSLREKHMALVNIILRTIAYPIRICCPDHWLMWASLATSFRQPAIAHIPPPSDDVSGRPVRTSLTWIPNNFPQSRIALVIKKLWKHQNLTQFD